MVDLWPSGARMKPRIVEHYNPATGETGEMPHPADLAFNQIADAQSDLDRDPSAYVRWPFAELDELTGPLGAGGDIWFVCAFSGGGKTTFITSVIEAWRLAGKRIYVMPLETRPKRFRTILACVETGIHPGDALSGRLRIDGRDADRERLKTALLAQGRRPYVDQVMIAETKAINVAGLRQGFREAEAFGADVVIVDHIDHLEGGDGSNPAADSKAVNHAALELAQEHGLLVVFTSQLNMDISRNPDRLAKYQPPQVHQVWLPGVKLHVASGMIGLFRTPRAQLPTETPEEYADKLKAARRGELPAPEILDPTVMGVSAMKLRNYGSHEGGRALLTYHHGRVFSTAEKDRYMTGFGGRMLRAV